VPLPAKPIIDMLAVVTDYDAAAAASAPYMPQIATVLPLSSRLQRQRKYVDGRRCKIVHSRRGGRALQLVC
jgi:hypothetical protein